MRNTFKLIILLGLALAPFFMFTGCGNVDPANEESPVWVQTTGTFYSDATTGEDSTVALIDVCKLNTDKDMCIITDEYASVTFYVQHTDPEWDGGYSPYFDVHLTKARISYFRTDGGTNVPGTFELGIDYYCPFQSAVTFPVKILHADQKWDPPLIWLNILESFGYEPDTGLSIIKGYCVMQFWGQDNAGFNVNVETQLPVEFADWGDET